MRIRFYSRSNCTPSNAIMKFTYCLVLCLLVAVEWVESFPNTGRQLQEDNQSPPMNYDFEWNVDHEEESNYYGQKESANNGRVEGTYYNWLADGRLMRVDYYVDGDSGFVPTITYENPYTPTWGTKFLKRK